MHRILALLFAGLMSLTLDVAHAQSISAPSIYDDCQAACADECSWMRPRKCRKTMRKCQRKGAWVCGGLPVTTTTSPVTTTTTLPGGPNFSAYSGTWGYAVSYTGTPSGACTTQHSADLGGTTALTVTSQGGIDGTLFPNRGGSVSCVGGFTAGSSAAVQSPWFIDVYGCSSYFNAYMDGWSLTSQIGALQVDLYQECSPGIVCVDVYTGAIAR
jgi:hypothetical protein